MKNVRLRADGRYEWRKQINGISYQKINKNKKELEKQIREFMKLTKKAIPESSNIHSFLDLAWEWFDLYKKNIISNKTYSAVLQNHFNIALFKKDIRFITYLELEKFLTQIPGHRTKAYCYHVIKGVFKEAYKRNIIQKDVSDFVNKPKNETQKGTAFSFKEQSLILGNLDKTKMGNEILFYLMTGCRRSEGYNLKLEDINFQTKTIYIRGTKTHSSKRYVPISSAYATLLKQNFNSMFKLNKSFYTHEFGEFLKLLGIKDKKLHDLRHTFSTNLYYLGVPDKQRQQYMGHASIVMTNDIYTTLEPNITKKDILNLYKDLYPKF